MLYLALGTHQEFMILIYHHHHYYLLNRNSKLEEIKKKSEMYRHRHNFRKYTPAKFPDRLFVRLRIVYK